MSNNKVIARREMKLYIERVGYQGWMGGGVAQGLREFNDESSLQTSGCWTGCNSCL